MNKYAEEFERALHGNGLQRTIPRDTPRSLCTDSPTLQLSKAHIKISREEHAEKPRPVVSSAYPSISSRVENHLISLLNAHSFEAEQYRKLCYLIERFHNTAGLSVIAISSAAAGDGKTTTAINLAVSLAKTSGERVLLIDFDLRRPSISAYLGREEKDQPGILELIRNPHLMSLDDVTVDVAVNLSPMNLSILFARQAVTTPYEVPESWQIEGLIASVRPKYKYVIIDTPPIFPFLDCQLLERFVDGILFVIAKHKTPRQLVKEAVGTLDPNKVIGMILNNSDIEQIPGYYGYRTYYRYGERQRGIKSRNAMGRFMKNWKALFWNRGGK